MIDLAATYNSSSKFYQQVVDFTPAAGRIINLFFKQIFANSQGQVKTKKLGDAAQKANSDSTAILKNL